MDPGEVYTQAGRHARDVVTTVLAQVDVVVVATRRTDIYGRYVADVKHLPGADPQTVLQRGTYLNRQRLDQGLARRYYG